MNYLSDSEYENYGMEPATAASLVAAASALINTYCRRPTFAILQYTERIRIAPERNNLRLTYLPLAIAQGAIRRWSPDGRGTRCPVAARIPRCRT